jgi:hypothetical protein
LQQNNESKEELVPIRAKRKRGGDIEFEDLKDLANIKNLSAKLSKILEIFAVAPDELSLLTEPCRKFCYRRELLFLAKVMVA